MISMDAIHLHVEKGGKHGKVGATLFMKQMTTYEQFVKDDVMLNPPPPPKPNK
jgi:hypothetical protein